MPNTWICASASRDDVNYYAGDGAGSGSVQHGDTVVIPGGNPTWTSGIDCTKGIHLRGSGISTTIIQDAIPKTGAISDTMFRMAVNSPNRLEMSDFAILGGIESDGSNGTRGHITVSGLSTEPNVRIHHIHALNLDYPFMVAWGSIFGLMDHIEIRCPVQNATPLLALIYHGSFNGIGAHGDNSWATPLSPGGPNQFYIEDCYIEGAIEGHSTVLQNMIDSFQGGRVVVRHNRFVRCGVGTHGTETGQRERATRWNEIYNNTFEYEYNISPIDTVCFIRGGSGVIFGNNVSGANVGYNWNTFVKLDNYRSRDPYPPWGKCDGTSAYDTEAGDPDGYRCVDQVGAGTSDLLSGDPPTAQPVNNILEPYYIWNNTYVGSSGPPAYGYVGPAVGHIVINRDYYEDTSRPSYSPYTYPHPLQGVGNIVLMGSCLS